jgi:hypothetical protein
MGLVAEAALLKMLYARQVKTSHCGLKLKTQSRKIQRKHTLHCETHDTELKLHLLPQYSPPITIKIPSHHYFVFLRLDLYFV